MALDMTTIARFLVLPGAEELVEAFSRIPPGPLRDSVVSHAQVIADTYSAAPAAQQMPDPLLMASNAQGGIAKAISGPRVGEIKVDDPATKAVQLRLQGRTPDECAEETGLTLLQVNAAFKRAKSAGVVLPPLPKGAPLSEVPTRRFIMFMTEMDPRAEGVMRKAAERLGLTLKQYVAKRRKLVELRRENTRMDELVRALRPVPEETLWRWITDARRAHIDIPANLAEEADPEPVAPPAMDDGPRYDLAEDEDDGEAIAPSAQPSGDRNSADMARPQTGVWPIPYDQMHWMEQKFIRAAAKSEGKTSDEIIARHKVITDALLAGRYPVQLQEDHGFASHLIQSVIRVAERYGVVFPPRKRGGGASKAMGRPLHMEKLAAARAKRPAEPALVEQEDPQARAILREGRITFPLFTDELTGMGRAAAERSAAKMNATLEGYMSLRRDAVAMFIRGMTPPEVAAELGLDVKMMSNWDYQSRVAGRQIVSAPAPTPPSQDQASEAAPRAAAAPEPPAPLAPPTTQAARTPPPEPAPERSPAAAEVPSQRQEAVRGFWTDVAKVPERGRAMAEQAAREMGLTLEEYAAVRRRAVELFQKGFFPANVATELNLTTKQASNWRDRMKGAGLLQFGGEPVIANDTPDEQERLEA